MNKKLAISSLIKEYWRVPESWEIPAFDSMTSRFTLTRYPTLTNIIKTKVCESLDKTLKTSHASLFI